MKQFEGELCRHELLAAGAFNVPDTVHMHFYLGAHSDVQRQLYQKLMRFGAMPKESRIVAPALNCMVSFPAGIEDQLASHGLLGLRLVDDLDIETFSARLERVLGHMSANGKPEIAETADGSRWKLVTLGYKPVCPSIVEIHHTVRIPRTGAALPMSLEGVRARSKALNIDEWTLFEKHSAWCFRSSKRLTSNGSLTAVMERNAAKLASLYMDVKGVEIAVTVEQVIACWEYPLQAAESNRNRFSRKQVMGVSERRLPVWSDVIQQCEAAAPADRLLVRDETRRTRIIANLETFRRIVIKQGCDPLIAAVAERKALSRRDSRPIQPVIAAGEQVFAVTAPEVKHYRRAEDVFRRTTSAMGRSTNARLSSATFLMVPFRSSTGAPRESLRGCLFALIVAPDADPDRIENLAVRLSLMLHRVTFDAANEAAASVQTPEPPLDYRSAQLRIEQVKDHDVLWTALRAIFRHPSGVRIEHMEKESPAGMSMLVKYALRDKFKAEIETSSKLTPLVEAIWSAMADGNERSNLYFWRRKAGLPKKRPSR
jgi:hypothetical protein